MNMALRVRLGQENPRILHHTYKDNSFNGTTGLMLCFKSKSVIAGHRCESMYLLFLKRNKGAVLNTKPLQSVLAADCSTGSRS